MAGFKTVTDKLLANDLMEVPGKLTVVDDLTKVETPDNYVEKKPTINVTYHISKSENNYWQNFVKTIFNNSNEN